MNIKFKMNIKSFHAVSLYQQYGIISEDLSLQYKVAYPVSTRAERSTWPSSILSISEAYQRYPKLESEIGRYIDPNATESVALHTAKACMIDTSFLVQDDIRSNYKARKGLVFLLPEAFLSEISTLINQKPSVGFARTIELIGFTSSFCWQVTQRKEQQAYDLWVNRRHADVMDIHFQDECTGAIDYWTDVIIICKDTVAIGGFYFSTEDLLAMQVDSHGPTNYNPWKEFSEEDIEEACERAGAIDSSVPWIHKVCMNEQYQRYRQVDILEADI